VQDKGSNEVVAASIFSAKPDIKTLFPIPRQTAYENHMGPVTGTSCSPFIKRIFLTCSTDGTVRLYDVQGQRPCSVFEPGHNEYLTSVCWSPFRPCVFATISNTGTVYIFDLLASKHAPAYVLKESHISTKNKSAYTISFNPRQRDFLAVGYHDGTVKILQLNHSLSNQKMYDMKTLKDFLEEKGSEF
jgi:WD repeat-containing protein 34